MFQTYGESNQGGFSCSERTNIVDLAGIEGSKAMYTAPTGADCKMSQSRKKSLYWDRSEYFVEKERTHPPDVKSRCHKSKSGWLRIAG